MVRRALLLGVVVLLAVPTGSTCKVVNEDHCANQDVPGNEFCVELNTATPYCSPCRREYHGCVDYEPFACAGYDNEIGDPVESSTSEAPESTTDATASTSDASTSSSSSSAGSEGTGSGTAGSSG